MAHQPRTTWLRLLATTVVILLVATACHAPGHRPGNGNGGGNGRDDGDFVGRGWYRHRTDEYLAFATEDLNPGSILNVLAHAERAERDPDFTWDSGAVTVEGFADELFDMRNWKDTSDFDAAVLRQPAVRLPRTSYPTSVVAEIDDALLGYEYWFTEPTPDGVVDEKYYWSENHRIIFHTIEYLVGQRHPDAVVRERRAHGRRTPRRGPRADPRLARREGPTSASPSGTPTSTTRRTSHRCSPWSSGSPSDDEIADPGRDGARPRAVRHRPAPPRRQLRRHPRPVLHEGQVQGHRPGHLPPVAKLLFDDTDMPYTGVEAGAACCFARAAEYRLPEVIRRVAPVEGDRWSTASAWACRST